MICYPPLALLLGDYGLVASFVYIMKRDASLFPPLGPHCSIFCVPGVLVVSFAHVLRGYLGHREASLPSLIPVPLFLSRDRFPFGGVCRSVERRDGFLRASRMLSRRVLCMHADGST